MRSPISVRLDDDTRKVLEAAARERGIGLSTYLREIAEREARKIRKERMRAESRTVAEYAAASPEARAFYADWGTPAAEGGKQ